MRDFRFGVVLDGFRAERARLGLPEGFWHVAAMDVATWTVRLIQANNDLQIRCGGHAASSTRLSGFWRCTDPRRNLRQRRDRRDFCEADFETHAEER